MDLAWGYGTDTRDRGENQDCHGLFVLDGLTLAVVCDGMGGHAGGAHASALAVRTILDTMVELAASPVRERLAEAVRRANRIIYETGRKSHRLMGMGTTVVASAVVDEIAHIAHVGDSRVYIVRNGHARQVTRDHTMVNMFVDHDLLSAEDAASHPEAHVLARSLGVERQVEVEFQDPIALENGDVLVLCSDGVHGVLTDWEFGTVDWSDPQRGAKKVLNLVGDREGADNATVVAITAGVAGRMPPTEVPSPEKIEDTFTPSSQGPMRAPALIEDVDVFPDIDVGDITPHGHETTIDTPSSLSTGLPPRVKPTRYQDEVASVPEDIRASKAAPPTAKQDAANRSRAATLALTLGGMVVACGAIAVILFLFVFTSNDDGTSGVVVVDDPDEMDTPVAPVETAWFAPALPNRKRVIAPSAKKFVKPPPGGPIQYRAVDAARGMECDNALDILYEAMATSEDYAPLYDNVWDCFTQAHQRPLAEARLDSWEGFSDILHHFQGALELEPTAVQAPTGTELDDPLLTRAPPVWMAKAPNGIERRLEAWASSNDDTDQLRVVLEDRFGEPAVAWHLGSDLLIEAHAARALASVEDPSDEVIEWWARRVYIVGHYWSGEMGDVIRKNAPRLAEPIERLLREATRDFDLARDNWVPPVDGATPSDTDAPPVEAPPPPTVPAATPPEAPPTAGAKPGWKQVAKQIGLPELVAYAYAVSKGEAIDPRLIPVQPAEPVRPVYVKPIEVIDVHRPPKRRQKDGNGTSDAG